MKLVAAKCAMERRTLLSFVLLLSLVLLSDAIARPGKQSPRRGREWSGPLPQRFVGAMKVELDLSYDLSVPGKTSFVRFVVILPKSIEDKQEIFDIRFSPQPHKLFSKNGNDYAEFLFTKPRKQFKVTIKVRAVLFRYDLTVARRRRDAKPVERAALQDFLKHEKYVEKDDPVIQQIAAGATGKSDLDIVKSIYRYVVDNMKYSRYNKKDLGALYAARQKKGDCTEYADLFAALCRARNIPARVVDGYTAVYENTPAHTWVEVYLNEYGWVPVDPAFGDVKNGPSRPLDVLRPIYMYLSHIRNDEMLGNYHFSWYYYHGEKINVKDSAKIKASVIDERMLR